MSIRINCYNVILPLVSNTLSFGICMVSLNDGSLTEEVSLFFLALPVTLHELLKKARDHTGSLNLSYINILRWIKTFLIFIITIINGWFMVLSGAFNNISVILWWSVLLVEKT